MNQKQIKTFHNQSLVKSQGDLQKQENNTKHVQIHPKIQFRINKHQICQQMQPKNRKPSRKKKIWTYENEKLLIDLYIKYGNIWKQLAQKFENINGTFLKNKFYCQLRKGIRNLNFILKLFFDDQWSEFDGDIAFKLVKCTSHKYEISSKCPLGKKIEQSDHFPQQIVHRVYMISFFSKESSKAYVKEDEKNHEDIHSLIENINLVNERIDPKKSNRKKGIKISKQKSALKSAKIVTSNQIKIKADKGKQSPVKYQFKRCSLSESRQQIAKIQIVSIISDHSLKQQNLMMDESSQQICHQASGQNKCPEKAAVLPVRCSYRWINVKQLELSCKDYQQSNPVHEKMKIQHWSEQQFFPLDSVKCRAKMEDDRQLFKANDPSFY